MNNFIKNIVDTLSIIDNKKLELLKTKILENNSEIIILGNGGSNAIASHMAEDYTKALGKRATCFSDASRLTCYANDYGYDFAFVQFLKEFSTKDSLVILISSSGNSKNILNCAQYCMDNNIDYIILTGFEENNKLRNLSKNKSFLDFWVNSKDYGIVECSHEIILHSVI
jgi:D-sedoheptulose 7-phosphate isomerase